MIDMERAETVEQCRELEIPWRDVYAAAAAILNGTRATGGEDAMEASYKRYRRRSKKEPYRYHILRSIRPVDKPLGPRPDVWNYVHSLKKIRV